MIEKLKIVKKLLEELYELYVNDIDGEIIIIDDLDSYIYKGKKLHFDQNLIFYNNNGKIISIDGKENSNSLEIRSFIKLGEQEQISFDELKINSEEYKFLEDTINIIENYLKPKQKQH